MSARHLTLVTGRANTGKSGYILNELKGLAAGGARAIVLVPEQYTFETELRLSRALGGLLGIQVLSFERLAERVIDASGCTVPFLSAQGYQMVVRRIAIKKANELTAFGRVAARRGFAKEMAEVLVKCKRCCITPEQLGEAAARLPDGMPLRDKLLDVALLGAETERYLNSRYLSREDQMDRVLSLLEGSFAAGLPVYIDGFEGATNQHYRLLARLLEVCASLTVTLRLDPLAAPDADVFAPDQDAFFRLTELAQRAGVPVRTVEKTEVTKRIAPALLHLERNLYAYPTRVYAQSAPEVTLFGASSPRAEAESLADAILSLARGGMRYRDIAVVASAIYT